ncbi:MAG: aspartyl protease family protein [Terriglobales bacterium]
MPLAPFSAFAFKWSGRTDHIITSVELTEAFDLSRPPTPIPARVQATALWDTGATGSCITPAVADPLRLPQTGLRLVYHGGGTGHAKTYLANIYLPNGVAIAGVELAETPNTPQFGVIIGMNVITLGDFAVTNAGGQTWASFRCPSIEGIDYVAEANRIHFAGVNRNDPCPCGKRDANGKPVKFKKCHGATDASAR